MTPRNCNQEVLAKVLALLQTPMDVHQLAEYVHLSPANVRRYVRILHMEAPKRVYVHSWRKNSPGSPTRIFAAGDLEDAPKPVPFTGAEIRSRLREDPERRAREAARKRTDRIKARLKKAPSLVAAPLFGGLHGNSAAVKKRHA